MSYPVPANETGRLAAVRAFNILDSAPDIGYDEIGELAAQICQCPVAYIGFMEDDRIWLKAKYGLPPDFNQCPREIAFCATTVCGTEMIVAPDLRLDERFNQLPFVTGEPHLKFYCGMPLVTGDGYALGTLCVMDFEPRELSFEQTEFDPPPVASGADPARTAPESDRAGPDRQGTGQGADGYRRREGAHRRAARQYPAGGDRR